MIHAEWLKLKRSTVWLIGACMPILSVLIGANAAQEAAQGGAMSWDVLTYHILPVHRDLIFPVTMAALIAIMWRMETLGSNWVLIRTNAQRLAPVIFAKLWTTLVLAVYTQGFLLIATMGAGTFYFRLPSVFSTQFLATLGLGVVVALPLFLAHMFMSIAIASPITPVVIAIAGSLVSQWIIAEPALWVLVLIIPYTLLTTLLPYGMGQTSYIPVIEDGIAYIPLLAYGVSVVCWFVLCLLALQYTRR